jgi:hypothetical protein
MEGIFHFCLSAELKITAREFDSQRNSARFSGDPPNSLLLPSSAYSVITSLNSNLGKTIARAVSPLPVLLDADTVGPNIFLCSPFHIPDPEGLFGCFLLRAIRQRFLGITDTNPKPGFSVFIRSISLAVSFGLNRVLS